MNWTSFLLEVVTLAGIYGVLCLSLNLQFGLTGLINFGIVAYFAAGAYAYALITQPPPGDFSTYTIGLDMPMVVGFIGAGLAGALFAVATGWPSLRLRGEYLALTTFAFAEVLHSLLLNASTITNGSVGLTGVDRPLRDVFPGLDYRLVFAGLVLLFLAVCFLMSQRLATSPFGAGLKALRDDELSASMGGKKVRLLRLQVFVFGALMAGFAGAFYAWYTTVVSPDLFSAEVTFVVFIALVLGGVGSNLGAVVGAAVLIGFEELIRFLEFDPSIEARVSGMRVALTGLLLAILLRLRPRPGEGPLGERLLALRRRLLPQGRGDQSPAPASSEGSP